MDDGGIVQVIIFALIVFGSVIASIIKKVNRWIEVHRKPRDMRPVQPGQAQAPAPTLPAGGAAEPQPGGGAAAPAKSTRAVLREELGKALSGMGAAETPEEEAPAAPAPRLPAAASAERESKSLMQGPALRTTASGQRVSASGIVMQDVAEVKRVDRGHLAVLQSAADLRRAVLFQVILSPPVSARGGRGPLRFGRGVASK